MDKEKNIKIIIFDVMDYVHESVHKQCANMNIPTMTLYLSSVMFYNYSNYDVGSLFFVNGILRSPECKGTNNTLVKKSKSRIFYTDIEDNGRVISHHTKSLLPAKLSFSCSDNTEYNFRDCILDIYFYEYHTYTHTYEFLGMNSLNVYNIYMYNRTFLVIQNSCNHYKTRETVNNVPLFLNSSPQSHPIMEISFDIVWYNINFPYDLYDNEYLRKIFVQNHRYYLLNYESWNQQQQQHSSIDIYLVPPEFNSPTSTPPDGISYIGGDDDSSNSYAADDADIGIEEDYEHHYSGDYIWCYASKTSPVNDQKIYNRGFSRIVRPIKNEETAIFLLCTQINNNSSSSSTTTTTKCIYYNGFLHDHVLNFTPNRPVFTNNRGFCIYTNHNDFVILCNFHYFIANKTQGIRYYDYLLNDKKHKVFKINYPSEVSTMISPFNFHITNGTYTCLNDHRQPNLILRNRQILSNAFYIPRETILVYKLYRSNNNCIDTP